MRYLLDTNILLWWLEDDQKLKSSIRAEIQDQRNQIFISIVSGIEISIKNRSGKLPLKTTLHKIFEATDFIVMDINLEHLFELDKLALHSNHKDPFDRMLIAQAVAENCTLITNDPKITKYKLSTISN